MIRIPERMKSFENNKQSKQFSFSYRMAVTMKSNSHAFGWESYRGINSYLRTVHQKINIFQTNNIPLDICWQHFQCEKGTYRFNRSGKKIAERKRKLLYLYCYIAVGVCYECSGDTDN